MDHETPFPPPSTIAVVAAGAELVNEVLALLAGAPTGGKGKKLTAGEAELSAEERRSRRRMRGWN